MWPTTPRLEPTVVPQLLASARSNIPAAMVLVPRAQPPVAVDLQLARVPMVPTVAIPEAATPLRVVVMAVMAAPVPKAMAPTALHLAAEVAVRDGHPAEPAMAEPVVTEWWW